MSINMNALGDVYATQNAYSKSKVDAKAKTETKEADDSGKVSEKKDDKATGFSDVAAVYEPSASSEDQVVTKPEKTDRSAIVQMLKEDNQRMIDSMQKMVMEMIQGQGKTLGEGETIWSFLASGDFTVTEAAKKQAQEAISEDGYWGVEQTSQRIVDFAKALAGDDVSKADKLLNAFKKGFEEATKTWGKELPDISKRTYEAVEKKFQAWKDEANAANATAPSPITE